MWCGQYHSKSQQHDRKVHSHKSVLPIGGLYSSRSTRPIQCTLPKLFLGRTLFVTAAISDVSTVIAFLKHVLGCNVIICCISMYHNTLHGNNIVMKISISRSTTRYIHTNLVHCPDVSPPIHPPQNPQHPPQHTHHSTHNTATHSATMDSLLLATNAHFGISDPASLKHFLMYAYQSSRSSKLE